MTETSSTNRIGSTNRMGSTAEARTVVRRPAHPARSARILSTGLAATATFGLISGYAYAAKNAPANGNTGEISPVISLAPVVSAPAGDGASTVAAQAAPQSQAAQPPTGGASSVVVDVPAPAPAAPAAGGGGGSGQPSSGSR